MIKIFVMLIWAGGFWGGPSAVSGFTSMDSCVAAAAVVKEGYTEARGVYPTDTDQQPPRLTGYYGNVKPAITIGIVCRELTP